MTQRQAAADGFLYQELFVAVDLPGPAAERLGKVTGILARVADPVHIRAWWVPPELMHVTLLHLGRIREDLVEVVLDAVVEAAGEVAPFACTMGRLGVHGGTGDEPVDALWALVEDGDRNLAHLRDALARALEDLGVQHHSPAVFEPHVPLGLFEKFNATREFGSVLMEQEALERLDLPVREIVLMENRAPDGVREQPFRPLRRVELRGGRA